MDDREVEQVVVSGRLDYAEKPLSAYREDHITNRWFF